MAGKVCLVTGATSGIGVYIALGLAERGAHVILVGRSRRRAEAARRLVRAATVEGSIEILIADLSLQRGVQQLAEQVLANHQRLDVLVNNAGGLFLRREETDEGLERTWALNHLGYFSLTLLLLDLLRAGAPARVVNVASNAHHQGMIHWDDPGLRRGYNLFRAYAQSKLANVMFTGELAARLAGSGVTANALTPGFVSTNLGKQNLPLWPILTVVYGLFAKSPRAGAETALHLATSPEVAGQTGGYFKDSRPAPTSPAARDPASAARLWDLSLEMSGLNVTRPERPRGA
jgi:NAD(P)-dependent dehydrogenase (short-subunit alcohol dehydrogenase family)